MTALGRLRASLVERDVWRYVLEIVRAEGASVGEVFAMDQGAEHVRARHRIFSMLLARGMHAEDVATLFACHVNTVFQGTHAWRHRRYRRVRPLRVRQALAATRANVERMLEAAHG